MTNDVIDSVIESQAIALSAKLEQIKKLEESLKIAGNQIKVLQDKVDAGLYQNMIDQIMEAAVDALDDALSGREVDFVAEVGTDGDTVNIALPYSTFKGLGQITQAVLRRIATSCDVFVQSTVASRQLNAQVMSATKALVEKVTAVPGEKLAFRRLSRPLPGTGALCAACDNKYGLRVIMTYSPETLSNRLHMDVLCGGSRLPCEAEG